MFHCTCGKEFSIWANYAAHLSQCLKGTSYHDFSCKVYLKRVLILNFYFLVSAATSLATSTVTSPTTLVATSAVTLSKQEETLACQHEQEKPIPSSTYTTPSCPLTEKLGADRVVMDVGVWKQLFEGNNCASPGCPGLVKCVDVCQSGLICSLIGECSECKREAKSTNVQCVHAC